MKASVIDLPREARVKSNSKTYHIIFRGANKQEIFHDEEDCMRFLDTLIRYKLKSGMRIYAWCLMNNHAHFLLKEGSEDISITMKRIGVSYVHFYNTKYLTTGHLFQDRFKSENVETSQSLLRAIRYIHQNPVKAGMVNQVDEWRWSSCHEYYGHPSYPMQILDVKSVYQFFSDNPKVAKERFREFNELKNDDTCLEGVSKRGRRLTDNEARPEIRKVLGAIEIAQFKSVPKDERDKLIRNIKQIKGLSQRQAARILGVSPNLIFRA